MSDFYVDLNAIPKEEDPENGTSENTEEQVDPEDNNALHTLMDWFQNEVDFLPSNSRKYALKVIQAGIPNPRKLARYVQRNPNFLISIGMSEEHSAEVISAMNSDGLFLSQPEKKDLIPLPDPATDTPQSPISIEQVPPSPLIPPPAPEDTTQQLTQVEILLSKRRFRRRETPEKFEKTLSEAKTLLENLNTAIDQSMSLAISGQLVAICQFVESNPIRQYALYKLNCAEACLKALVVSGKDVPVCENTFHLIALLCRCCEENKFGVCFENAQVFSKMENLPLLVRAMQFHNEEPSVMMAACDAIRCLCSTFEANRIRLGSEGACEVMGRSLFPYAQKADMDTLCWLFRGIGHLAVNNDSNREIFGSVGVCEIISKIIEAFGQNHNLCVEICWAIRNVALTENNRTRFYNQKLPYSIAVMWNTHPESVLLAIEGCRSLLSIIGSEEDDVVKDILGSKAISKLFSSLKKYPESEILSRWAFNLFYYIACKQESLPFLVKNKNMISVLSEHLQKHASYELMAEWGLKLSHKLAVSPEYIEMMRNAGLCEVVIETLQRQAISVNVCSQGCLTIGLLAFETDNLARLSRAGGCEVVINTLKRHDTSPEAVKNACIAIHYLCQNANNVPLMGVCMGCEALTEALELHIHDAIAAHLVCRAIGSLALDDDGNQSRFLKCTVVPQIIKTFEMHATSPEACESACRAVYNLTRLNTKESMTETEIVNAFNKKTCHLVSQVLDLHATQKNVVTQALLAIFGLSIKKMNESPYQKNSRQFEDDNVVPRLVAVSQKYPLDTAVQRAAAMAISALACSINMKKSLGLSGACDLILSAFKAHPGNPEVVSKLFHAVSNMSNPFKPKKGKIMIDDGSLVNKTKFIDGGVLDFILHGLKQHERNVQVVTEAFRSLVILSSFDSEASRNKLRQEANIQLYIRVMRTHEKDEFLSQWACNLLACIATDDITCKRIGEKRGCEVVATVLQKHSLHQGVGCWASKAIRNLSAIPSNRDVFKTKDLTEALVKALRNAAENILADPRSESDVEVALAVVDAIVAISPVEGNRARLGNHGVCVALASIFTANNSKPALVSAICQAIFEISIEPSNREKFSQTPICSTLMSSLNTHLSDPVVSKQYFKAISKVALNNPVNAAVFGTEEFSANLIRALSVHASNRSLCEWACSCIYSTSDKNLTNQSLFGDHGVCDVVVSVLKNYIGVCDETCMQSLRAARGLTGHHTANSMRMAKLELPQIVLEILATYNSNASVVDHGCFLLSSVEVPRSLSPEIFSNIYCSSKNWDLFHIVLQIHNNTPEHARVIRSLSAAISLFSSNGRLCHGALCESVQRAIETHAAQSDVVNNLLFAVGSLAHCHPDNRATFTRRGACAVVEAFLLQFAEVENGHGGVFRAVTGLADGSPENQASFDSKNFQQSLLKFLYNNLETEDVARWGCEAITSLSFNNWKHQFKLGKIAEFVFDILEYYRGNEQVTLSACRMIAMLAHKNITNRNRFSSSEIFLELSHILMSTPSDPWVTYWAVRAVADLAASNPSNQAKLASSNICESLVTVMRRLASLKDRAQAAYMTRYTCWAVGNLVQLGLRVSTVMDDGSSSVGLAGAGGSSSSSSSSVATSSSISSSPSKGVRGQIKNSQITEKNPKNAIRLHASGVVELLLEILDRFHEDLEVMKWAVRAINNLSKSRTLRQAFLDRDTESLLQRLRQEHSNDPSLSEWIDSVLETFREESSTETSSSLRRVPSVTSANSLSSLTANFPNPLKKVSSDKRSSPTTFSNKE